jgi:hypothetical protein
MFAKLVNLFRRTKPGFSRVVANPATYESPYDEFIDGVCLRFGKTREELYDQWGCDETTARGWFRALEGAGVERVKNALDTQTGTHIRI